LGELDVRKFMLGGFVIVSLCLLTALDAKDTKAERYQKVLESTLAAYNGAEYEAMTRLFSKNMAAALPPEKCRETFEKLMTEVGKMEKIAPPRFVDDSVAVFVVRFEKSVLDLKLVVNDKSQIEGLWFSPHAAEAPVPERNSVPMALPFKGNWFVYQGGETREENYHMDTPNQRFAADFGIVDESGKSYRTDGKANEDYYTFGQEVYAPGDGTVIEVIDGVRDNVPGSRNSYSAVGNAVFIEHAKNEVSMIAHFQQYSIRVKPGDKVAKGDLLGLCGNSGNSSDAHIHFHLQNVPAIQEATGVKCLFERVVIHRGDDTETKDDYMPRKGQTVSPE
jgi:murein DD-endopeptidase MepM/ murein hydrolase activator NlpD